MDRGYVRTSENIPTRHLGVNKGIKKGLSAISSIVMCRCIR